MAADLSNLTSKILAENGFSRYEISNYALPGHCSRHNRVYWSGAGWWGFGQGATSSPWGVRFSRPRSQKEYLQWVTTQINHGIDASLIPENQKPVDLDDQIMVGLRRREGVDFKLLAKRYGWSDCEIGKYLPILLSFWSDAMEAGLLVRNGDRFKLTDPVGMDLSNQVIVQMLLWWDSLPIHSDS